MKIYSLGTKISLAVTVLIAAIIILVVLIVSIQTQALISDLTESEARTANHTFTRALQDYEGSAAFRAQLISFSSDLIDGIDDLNMLLIDRALTRNGEGLDEMVVTDTSGVVIFRSDSDMRGDSIIDQKAIAGALANDQVFSIIEAGPDGGLFVRGASPVKDRWGNMIGAISCSHDLSLPKYVDEIQHLTNCEVSIFHGEERISTTIVDDQGVRIVGTTMFPIVAETVLERGEVYSSRIDLYGTNYEAYYSPLIVDDEIIGALSVGVHIEGTLSAQAALIRWVIMVAAIAGVCGVVFVFMTSMSFVSRPLKKIAAFAEKISAGELGITSDTAAKIDVHSHDEVGSLARDLEQSFNQLRGYIGEIKEKMQGLAEGDLTTKSVYNFNGDFTLIKDSINAIIGNLNRTMSEINVASTQVTTGSAQIASGSSTLAQGTSEQAAAIEELSASIVAVAEMIKATADLANSSAELAKTMQINAEKGNAQMNEMMAAVDEISDASLNIRQVIKTIDDIAFQTNILALNASIEAARAGVHGKGFAVVAEEVRSLAVKSAEAAKDTGALIANSIEKAELGARIASDTKESFTEIINGIDKSSQIAGEIAASSGEQAYSIEQINRGIDQVSQVVMQNSLTAKDSANSSAKMSEQSSLLKKLIQQFRL